MRIITTLLLLFFLCLGCEKPIDYQIDENSAESSLAKAAPAKIGETPFPCSYSSFKVNCLLSSDIIELELLSNELTEPELPKSINWIIDANNNTSVSNSSIVNLQSSSGKEQFVGLTLDFGNGVTSQVEFCIVENNSRLEICTSTEITGGGLPCKGGKDGNSNSTIDQRAGAIEVFIY